MAPTKFDDLGKSAKDLFSKGYNFGFLKIDTKTKTGTGLEFKSTAAHNTASSKLHGTVDIKYKFPDYNVTVTEKWDTNNQLGCEVVIQDEIAKGLKMTFDTAFTPQTTKKSAKVKAEYAIDRVMFDTVFNANNKEMTSNAVIGHGCFALGLSAVVDLTGAALKRHQVAFGYKNDQAQLHAFVANMADFRASVYHKVSPCLEVGVVGAYNKAEPEKGTSFGLATQYQLDRETKLQAKLNQSSECGVSMTHTVRPGLKLILSSLINLKEFSSGGHKCGFGIEYEH